MLARFTFQNRQNGEYEKLSFIDGQKTIEQQAQEHAKQTNQIITDFSYSSLK
ncbi:hypothetical protein D3C73_278150 [compost metagenome]